MPKKCHAKGDRIRTKKLKEGHYLHICFPPGGGKGVAGYIHVKHHEAHGGMALKKHHFTSQGALCPMESKRKPKKKLAHKKHKK